MVYYGPNEDAPTIFLERTFLTGVFVYGVGYGVQVVLYVRCVLYLIRKHPRRGGFVTFLLLYITVLLILSFLWGTVGAWTIVDVYINNRNYPNGPWAYFLATQDQPENVLFITILFISTFLSDLLVLWRCWVIWFSITRRLAYVAAALPFLLLLASSALGAIWCLQSSQPGLSMYNAKPIIFGTSYYISSLSVNIVVTILIVMRLALHRRAILESLPLEYGEHYLSVATIVVESAALYSVFSLGFIISYAINNPINQIFLVLSYSSQQIAGYLIILRIARGRAWTTSTLRSPTEITPQLSTVQLSEGSATTQVDSKDVEAQGCVQYHQSNERGML